MTPTLQNKYYSGSRGVSNIVAEVVLTLLALTILVGFLQLTNSSLNAIERKDNNALVLLDYITINKTTLLMISDEDVHINLTYPNATILVFNGSKWVSKLNIRAGEPVLVKINGNSNFSKLILITDSGMIVLKNS